MVRAFQVFKGCIFFGRFPAETLAAEPKKQSKEENMSISKKAWLSTVVAGAVAMGVMGMSTQADAAYKATFYVAGMGGHFAKAEATIDPSAKQPIQVTSLTKVDIGSRADHPVHDPRIDANDSNTMFWSTYKRDKATNAAHVGKTDLKTGNVIMDVDASVPEQATKDGSLYCGSGQSKTSYIPISMANKGYIDVFNKSDLKMTQRLFLEGTDADIGKPYKFYHGVNTPDFKGMTISINEADKDHGNVIGKTHFVTVDMAALEQGKIKVLKKGMAPGAEGATISFRMTYSPDGKLLAASGADRMWLMDSDLNVLDAEMVGNLEQNHDAMFTPDGKYVIATSRSKAVSADCKDPEKPKEGEFIMDGHLKLYDVAAQKWVGESTSVCLSCHDKEGITEHAILCGLDANFSM
jgi:hypothetical protein